MARVLIAHDVALMAEAIALALGAAGHEVTLDPTSTTEGVYKTAVEWCPRVTLLGIELRRGVPDGLGLVSSLKALGSAVIVFTPSQALTLQAVCLDAGADAFVAEAEHLAALLSLVERAVKGEKLLSDRARSDIRQQALARARSNERLRARFARLSIREREVLQAIIHGKAAQEIAADTFVSLATIRSHIRSILIKLSVTSQLAAVAAATEAGWPDARRAGSNDADGRARACSLTA